MKQVICYLALGSNLGDRFRYLAEAEARLAENPFIRILKKSNIHETDPQGMHAGAPVFLNQCLEISTTFSPLELLNVTQLIEKHLGRENKGGKRDRTLDIDILLYGNEVIDLPGFSIPHPRMKERRFVLLPLLEIAPDLRDPVTGARYRDILPPA